VQGAQRHAQGTRSEEGAALITAAEVGGVVTAHAFERRIDPVADVVGGGWHE
jgi:hypothetical protein